MDWGTVLRNHPLRTYTTLKAGGAAEFFTVAKTSDSLRLIAEAAQKEILKITVVGWGSNMLASDAGVPGLAIINEATGAVFSDDGHVECDSGIGFQNLFLMAAQRGLKGLEFAVGIPGSLGGALVSNAGAYRSSIDKHVVELEVTLGGKTEWVDPAWMRFDYRDSVLRCENPIQAVINRVRLQLEAGDREAIYEKAREYQRQRIGKQPAGASAGSFFKNVVDQRLAQQIDGLTPGMREAGVIPAGFLIEACQLKGRRLGGAMVGRRHANFLLNVGGASATEIRSLAHHVQSKVADKFGIQIEEEVMYLGDWTGFEPLPLLPVAQN